MLQPAEREVVRAIEARLEEEIAFLESVVNVGSATSNLAGVRAAGELFRRELDALGFSTRWVELPPDMRRAGHLVAERVDPAAPGRRVLLIGHLDTILEGRFERGDPLEQRVSPVWRARGAGASDMKGGCVAMLFALRALHEAGRLERATVRVVLTGDEENPAMPGEVSRGALIEAARQSDVALSFESDTGRIAIGRRGLSLWSLDVSARQGHSANVLRPRAGAGAIYEAARILDGFRRAFSGDPNVTVNTGILLGGTDVSYDPAKSAGAAAGKFNVIARSAAARGDLRFVTDAERDSAQTRMREHAGESLARTSARISFEDLAPGWPPSDANRAVLAVIDEASRDLGLGPAEADDPGTRGFGDFNFIGGIVAGADGLGVKGDGEHGPEETIDLTSLAPCTARAAVVIGRLLGS